MLLLDEEGSTIVAVVNECPGSSSQTPVEILESLSVEFTYETYTEKKRTVEELLDFCKLPFDKQTTFFVRGSIVDINLNNGWRYPACSSCSKMVTKHENHFFCARCNKEPPMTWLSYRIELVVEDHTFSTTFVMFNTAAVKLLNVSASDLASEYPNELTRETMPIVMNKLIGMEFLFLIRVTDFNRTTIKQNFTVIKVHDPADIPSMPLDETEHNKDKDDAESNLIPDMAETSNAQSASGVAFADSATLPRKCSTRSEIETSSVKRPRLEQKNLTGTSLSGNVHSPHE